MRTDIWHDEDFDDEFWLIVSLYGPWAFRTTPAVNKRRAKKLPGEGDKKRRRGQET